MSKMQVFSIRVDEEVKNRLAKMDKDYIRKVLTEIAGMTYTKENKLVDAQSILQESIKNIVEEYLKNNIDELVEKYLKDNIDKLNDKNIIKDGTIDKEITELAKESILSIMDN